jgi:formylglycine-generating enzyme required for sulfatase activity
VTVARDTGSGAAPFAAPPLRALAGLIMREVGGRPLWAWLAGALGALLLAYGATLPLRTLWRRSIAAMPKERTQAHRSLRPAMIILPKGKFLMGSPPEAGFDHERPQHEVEIAAPFAMSETEVTQAQYQAVMEKNPSNYKDAGNAAQRPVESVSWLDAIEYCNRLSDAEKLERCYEGEGEKVAWKQGLRCKGYRLPTEAEWEYAARGGQPNQTYAGSDKVDDVAKINERSTYQVKSQKPNQWGLHDMSGNVWEWVWDWYQDSYKGAAPKDPTGPAGGTRRVFRGGSFSFDLRVAYRYRSPPGFRSLDLGFRIARSYP